MRPGIRHALASLLAIVLLAGCTNNMKDRAADASIVYGYMDMSEAPTDLDWVALQQVKPRTKEPFWQAGVQKVGKGYVFYHYGLPPGTYQLNEFGGQNSFLIFGGTPYTYSFPRQGRNETALEVGKPGVYFAGAFKYKRIKNGLFKADNFEVVPITEFPARAAMLEAMQKDAPQHPAVQAQLQSALAKAR